MSNLHAQAEPSLPVFNEYPLPVFDGSPFEWLNFYTEYDLTTRAYNISDETNVRRLCKALKGTAFTMVYSLFSQRKPANEIMDMLHQNFDTISKFFTSLLQRVYDVAFDHSGCMVDQMQRLCQALEMLIHNTATYGIANVLYNTSLTHYIARSLPVTYRKVWERTNISHANLYKLHQFTREQIGIFIELAELPGSVPPRITPVTVPPRP